jgi:dolichol-phosphate mannosyltransferase
MRILVTLFTIVQALLGVRMIARMIRSADSHRIHRIPTTIARDASVTVLLPVLNEAKRLAPCLEGLIAQGPDVREILIIDGGSADATRELALCFAERDSRVRLIDAAPIPLGINGKAWGLQVGYAHAATETNWMLTIDADVRPDPDLVSSLLAHAETAGVPALSAATLQRLSGPAEALVHPSMLTTLVYRFGIPGHATTDVARVQANGQCFLVRRDVLDATGGFAALTNSVCEDVTLARSIAVAGHPVGFYETDGLVSVEMYTGWREAWQNWSRSLPMRDRHSTVESTIGLVEVLLLQALPLWLTPVFIRSRGRSDPGAFVNTALLITRLGTLAGMARAYERRPWTYWLSPLCDLPVALRLWSMSWRRRHTWRGRPFVTGVSR